MLNMPEGWLDQHPLMRAELEQEMQYQQQTGWELIIK
jgi:exopolyphosphatase/guanosine-5'-triphosphate,3'-diphosphate pyrophosphatase